MSRSEHEVVPASALRPGDVITETTTPDGPWYEVVAADRARRLLVVDDGTGLVVEIPVADWSDPALRSVG